MPYYTLCKMSKKGNTSTFFNFFKEHLDLFKTNFFCKVSIKDSCVVDIENRRLYFLSYVWFETWDTWLNAAEDVIGWGLILGFNAFYRWFGAEVTSKKEFLLPLLHFIDDFAPASWLFEQIFYLIFLLLINFARQWLWMQIF